jgi:hypothetical protein
MHASVGPSEARATVTVPGSNCSPLNRGSEAQHDSDRLDQVIGLPEEPTVRAQQSREAARVSRHRQLIVRTWESTRYAGALAVPSTSTYSIQNAKCTVGEESPHGGGYRKQRLVWRPWLAGQRHAKGPLANVGS